MNTETRVHEYHLKTSSRACGKTAQVIYNEGRKDAINKFVEAVRKDIKKLPCEMGFVSKVDVNMILSHHMQEMLEQ